ncbi:MAG: SPOR domain-containing protein [Pseudomonadota bacterium]
MWPWRVWRNRTNPAWRASFVAFIAVAAGIGVPSPYDRAFSQDTNISPYLALAPDVFEGTGRAVWDGRRTLQGIWVAHPEATTARRVRIINVENRRAVDGALFKRDAADGGSSILISSEAAQLLGIVPNVGTDLRIVAVTPVDRQTIEPNLATPAAGASPITRVAAPPSEEAARPSTSEPPPAPDAEGTPEEPAQTTTVALKQPSPDDDQPATTVEAAPAEPERPAEPRPNPDRVTPANDPVFTWENAPAAADEPEIETSSTPVTPLPATTEPERPALKRPFVQAGTFGVATNASKLIDRLAAMQIPALTRSESVGGRTLTRVLAGPFDSLTARDDAQRKIRGLGLTDAVPVRR